jgi:hypothetical protein
MPASKAGALPLGDAPTRNLRCISYNDHELAGPYSVSQNERNRRFRSFTPRFFAPIHARLVRYRVGYPPVARAVFVLIVQGHLRQ